MDGLQPDDFRYFLTFDNFRTQIIFSPKGWDTDTIVGYKRDENYFGMVRSLGLPLQFVFDGAKIIRSAFYKYGIEAGVILEVDQINKDTWQYDTAFIGNIDFSKFKDTKDYCEVPLMQSGLSQDLKAFESVKYEYQLTGSDVVNIVLPGIGFTEDVNGIFPQLSDSSPRDDYIPASLKTTGDSPSGYISIQDNNDSDDFPDFTTSGEWFMLVNTSVPLTISGRIKGVAALNTDSFFRIMSSTNELIYNLPLVNSVPGSITNQFNANFSATFTPVAGRKYFWFLTTSTRSFIAALEGEYKVSFTASSDPSNCKGISAYNLFKRILKRISPATPSDSFLLSNTYKNLIFTSGDGIREIDGAKIKIDFKSFFATFLGLDDAAFGVDTGTARIEIKPYFARPSQSVDVGEAKEFELIIADNYIFNSVKIGYDDGNTDDTDGKSEYNSGQQWAMPISRIQRQESWVSPTRADQYGIEKLRLDYINKTDDTSSDNDTFMVDCYLDGLNYRPILGATYQTIEGVKSPLTSYNLALTPKKNLLRHGGYLRSMLDKLDGNYINFASGDKNTAFLTIKDGVRVKENENIQISTLPGKYFLPYIATITTKLPKNTMQLMDNMPFGYVTFTWNDVTLKGYIIEASIDLAKNSEREFKLLLTNDNDLRKLA